MSVEEQNAIVSNNQPLVIKQRNFISIVFCIAFIGLTIAFSVLIIKSHQSYTNAQNNLISTHQQHLNNIEHDFQKTRADFIEKGTSVEKKVVSIVDSISRLNFKSQEHLQIALHKELTILAEAYSLCEDDVLLILERTISDILKEQERLDYHLQLQLDKIGHGYSIIEIWAAVLSVLFLTFGFYAIFKIEESKREASDYLEGVKLTCEQQILSVTSQAESIRLALNESNTRLSNIESVNLDIKIKSQELDSLKHDAYKVIEEAKKECSNIKVKKNVLTDNFRKEFNQIIDNIIKQYNELDSSIKATLDKINKDSNG